MKRNSESPDLDPKQEALIFALLRNKTKEDAAKAAGVSRATVFRWFNDPKFMAAYRAARRDLFDDALAVLDRNAAKAAQALVDELDPDTATGSFFVMASASRLLQLAFKAQSAIAVEEELANLRTLLAALKAGQPPSPPTGADNAEGIKMATQEQAEATRLRVLWMSEIGNDAESIDNSLRYNRPQSVAEEAHLLELVRRMVAAEKDYEMSRTE